MSNNYEYLENKKYRVDKDTGFDKPNTNPCLKYVLVGITPGSRQRQKEGEREDDEPEFGTIEYKYFKAFAGKPMRDNIKEMFEFINDNKHKGKFDDLINVYGGKEGNIDKLFEYSKNSIIEFTSLLKDAVEVKNNKTGEYDLFKKPADINPKKHEQLYKEYEDGFLKDYCDYYRKCKDIVFIACGKQVYNFLIDETKIDEDRVFAIVHPSPAAQGWINMFLDKSKSKKKYNPEARYERKKKNV